jgi:hypothetical protein
MTDITFDEVVGVPHADPPHVEVVTDVAFDERTALPRVSVGFLRRLYYQTPSTPRTATTMP